MSKIFDSLNRNNLLNYLRNTTSSDELHIVSKLFQVSLSVKIDKTLIQEFQTDTGAPQGDYVSVNQFTYYLAKALEPVNNKNQSPDHPCHTPSHSNCQ